MPHESTERDGGCLLQVTNPNVTLIKIYGFVLFFFYSFTIELQTVCSSMVLYVSPRRGVSATCHSGIYTRNVYVNSSKLPISLTTNVQGDCERCRMAGTIRIAIALKL